jgi:formylmethanofuran dehydrogenase subunit E
MAFPEFFARVPAVTLRDPLAELLGAAEGGLIEYRFADAVKLTGHSCPTVAGAWLMTVRALRALYGDEIPERGNVAVALRESLDSGVAGVIGSVAGLLTGAAGAGGFKGLGGRHSRRNLLQFGVAGNGNGSVAFARRDTNAAVDCTLRLEMVPTDPRLGSLLGVILNGTANTDDTRQFRNLWQERVARLLIDHANDPDVVQLHRCRN